MAGGLPLLDAVSLLRGIPTYDTHYRTDIKSYIAPYGCEVGGLLELPWGDTETLGGLGAS